MRQHTNDTAPINADNEKIIFDSLSSNTQELLTNLRNSWGSALQLASAIKYYIVKNKKYSTKVQWTLRNKSNRNNYVKNLDGDSYSLRETEILNWKTESLTQAKEKTYTGFSLEKDILQKEILAIYDDGYTFNSALADLNEDGKISIIDFILLQSILAR